jgi:hypothetical protein
MVATSTSQVRMRVSLVMMMRKMVVCQWMRMGLLHLHHQDLIISINMQSHLRSHVLRSSHLHLLRSNHLLNLQHLYHLLSLLKSNHHLHLLNLHHLHLLRRNHNLYKSKTPLHKRDNAFQIEKLRYLMSWQIYDNSLKPNEVN